MSTTNPTLTTTWVKIADAGYSFLLTLPFSTKTSIEVATSDTDVSPSVAGHTVRGDQYESINRTLIGPGYVYAKSKAGSLPIVLNTWLG